MGSRTTRLLISSFGVMLIAAVSVIWAGSPQPALAAPPANDNLASASPLLPNPFTFAYNNVEATFESPFEAAPCGNMGSTVWFKLTPAETATITVKTYPVPGVPALDTVLAAYIGTEPASYGSLALMGCNDDIAGAANRYSSVSFPVAAGQVYYIQVGGFSGAQGAFYVGWEYADNLSDAIQIDSFPYEKAFRGPGLAGTEAGEQAPCGNFGRSMWFKWTSPFNRRLSVDTYTSAIETNTILSVYTGPASGETVGSLSPVACNNDVGYSASNLQVYAQDSRVAFQAQTGVTYYFQLHFSSNYPFMYFRLQVENDNTVNPVNASPVPFVHSQSNTLTSTQSGEPISCSSYGNTVWFEYTPAVNTPLIADTIGSNFDTVLAVYSSSSSTDRNFGTITSLLCNDDRHGTTLLSEVQFNATGGQRYVFQVGGYQGAAGDLVFRLQPDTDLDAIPLLDDNCPLTANGAAQAGIWGVGNQTDTDGDGVPGTHPQPYESFGGNACDRDDDNDGVLDDYDSCPIMAEDIDGFQDEDGCPDYYGPPDTDADGICDPGWSGAACSGSDSGQMCFDPAGTLSCATQNCSSVQEDYDGFKDGDGCPEPDNDNDGFPDTTDDCPGTDSRAGLDGMLGSPEDVNHNGVRDGAEAALTTDDVMPALVWEDSDGVLDTDGCHDSPGDDFDGDGLTDDTEVFSTFTNAGHPDTDADTVVDGSDNCPTWPNAAQAQPNWPIPAGDSDCDGYPTSANVGLQARETYIGTDPTRQCAADSTANNESGADKWPMDFNDNRLANGQDFLTFIYSFAQPISGPDITVPAMGTFPPERWDFTGNGIINGQDFLKYINFFAKTCS